MAGSIEKSLAYSIGACRKWGKIDSAADAAVTTIRLLARGYSLVGRAFVLQARS